MTGSEMNARVVKKMMRPMLMAGAVLGMASGLSACVGSFDPETDASSPLAPRVQALVDANRTYPRWEDFPRSSEPVPPAAQVAQQVNTLRATGGALANEVSTLQWQNGDPAALERDVAARVSATPISPDAARTAAELDAYAQSLRDRAKAPPPVGRQ
jgi:hypothetical protein